MNTKQARALAARIAREDPQCQILGIEVLGRYLRIVDTRTGYSFQVASPEDWDERVKAANWPAVEE